MSNHLLINSIQGKYFWKGKKTKKSTRAKEDMGVEIPKYLE